MMPALIDLSVPVRHGDGRLGLTVEFTRPYTYENVNWQGSSFCMFCHYGTHVDAPNHFICDGISIEQVPLDRIMGPAAVVELSDFGEEGKISGDILEARGSHIERNDIAVLRTGWSDKHWGTDFFWQRGPYLSPDAGDWLVERGVKAVVYDFSEEYVVRNPGFRGEDCLVHHKILGNSIFNIEYVINLARIEQPRCAIVALPLNLVGLDGSPSRVIALEGVDIPKEFTLG
jgi:kynurenine formamidase